MSQQAISLLDLTITSLGVITEYRAVGFDGAQASVANQKVLGLARRGAAGAGIPIDVTVQGTAVAEAGGVFAAGVALATDNQGRLVAAAALAIATGGVAVTSVAANGASDISGGDPPQFIVGYALQASTGAGDKVEVLLR